MLDLSHFVFMMSGQVNGVWKIIDVPKDKKDWTKIKQQILMSFAQNFGIDMSLTVTNFENTYRQAIYTGEPEEKPPGVSIIGQFVIHGSRFGLVDTKYCLVEVWEDIDRIRDRFWAIAYDIEKPLLPQVIINIGERDSEQFEIT